MKSSLAQRWVPVGRSTRTRAPGPGPGPGHPGPEHRILRHVRGFSYHTWSSMIPSSAKPTIRIGYHHAGFSAGSSCFLRVHCVVFTSVHAPGARTRIPQTFCKQRIFRSSLASNSRARGKAPPGRRSSLDEPRRWHKEHLAVGVRRDHRARATWPPDRASANSGIDSDRVHGACVTARPRCRAGPWLCRGKLGARDPRPLRRHASPTASPSRQEPGFPGT